MKATKFEALSFLSYLDTLFHTIDLQGTDSIGEGMHPQMVEGRRPPLSLLCQPGILNTHGYVKKSDESR